MLFDEHFDPTLEKRVEELERLIIGLAGKVQMLDSVVAQMLLGRTFSIASADFDDLKNDPKDKKDRSHDN